MRQLDQVSSDKLGHLYGPNFSDSRSRNPAQRAFSFARRPTDAGRINVIKRDGQAPRGNKIKTSSNAELKDNKR